MPKSSSSFGFTSVTISFLIHATEDVSSLINLVSNRLGLSSEAFEVRQLEGHYGNALHYASAHVTGNTANTVSDLIFANLDNESRSVLTSNIESSLDEHDALYIRLDRQLLGERLTFGSEEPIRIKFKPKNRKGGRKTIREEYTDLLRR